MYHQNKQDLHSALRDAFMINICRLVCTELSSPVKMDFRALQHNLPITYCNLCYISEEERSKCTFLRILKVFPIGLNCTLFY